MKTLTGHWSSCQPCMGPCVGSTFRKADLNDLMFAPHEIEGRYWILQCLLLTSAFELVWGCGPERFLFMERSSLVKLYLLHMIEIFTWAFSNQMKMKLDPYIRRAELEIRYGEGGREKTKKSWESKLGIFLNLKASAVLFAKCKGQLYVWKWISSLHIPPGC